MPFLHVSFVGEPDDATQAALIRDLTDAVVTHLEVPVQTVSVVLEPVPARCWGVGGNRLSEVLNK